MHCMLTMSTTVWLGMNSKMPSLPMRKNGLAGVRFLMASSGSAHTPIVSAAAAKPLNQ